MADAINDAASNIDSAKAAALAALARGGTSGLAAYQAAQAATGADRQAAIHQALASATGLNAPAGAGAALQTITARPYDQYAATNATLSNAFQQAQATRTGAADTYFKEAAAAVPIVRAQAEGRVAILRQQAADKAAAKQADANSGYGGTPKGTSAGEIKQAAVGKATRDAAQAAADAKAAKDAYDAASNSSAQANIEGSGSAVGYREAQAEGLSQPQVDSRMAALKAASDQANVAAFLHAQQVAAIDKTPVNVQQQQAASALYPQLSPDIVAGMFPEATAQQQLSTYKTNQTADFLTRTGFSTAQQFDSAAHTAATALNWYTTDPSSGASHFDNTRLSNVVSTDAFTRAAQTAASGPSHGASFADLSNQLDKGLSSEQGMTDTQKADVKALVLAMYRPFYGVGG